MTTTTSIVLMVVTILFVPLLNIAGVLVTRIYFRLFEIQRTFGFNLNLDLIKVDGRRQNAELSAIFPLPFALYYSRLAQRNVILIDVRWYTVFDKIPYQITNR